jgi:hypothetical protein
MARALMAEAPRGVQASMPVINSGTTALSSRAELAAAVYTYTRGGVGKGSCAILPHGGGVATTGFNVAER